ncbi:MAG: ankyrin repeat domain-containing protein [Burkholderiales bacterium]
MLRALASMLALAAAAAGAQVPPSPSELSAYTGVFAAAATGDTGAIARLAASGANVNAREAYGRTPLHVAAFMKQREAMKALVDAGADPNALDADRYDMVTIAAVANDPATLEAALKLGNRATNVTSRYDGTALIAAAHLGHVEVVRILVKAGAPLDHVNNLGWTALIESIVLGDGGALHTATLGVLVDAGANVNIGDRQGLSPLHLAEGRGYREMADILKAAGAQ